MPAGITCEEKLSLLVEYQQLTQVLSTAIGKMAVRGISQFEYDRLSRESEWVREASIEARQRLNRHIAEHGC